MRKSIASLLMALLVAAAGCNGSKGPKQTGVPNPPFEGDPPQERYIYKGETGTYGGQMVLALPDDVKTFNIVRATDTASSDVLWFHVFRCLVDYRNGDDKPDFDNGLCTRWEVSPDAKQWTFYLRKGVRWSDGHPFTADDVVFTYNVSLDPNVDTASRSFFSEDQSPDGKELFPSIEKIDDTTVRFNLNKPNGSFRDSIFNLFLIPKHKWEDAWRAGNFRDTMKTSDDPTSIPGLGPFRLKEYVTAQRVVLERNPFYWKVDSQGNRLPYLDRLVFVIAKDFNTVQSKFEAEELDGMQRVRATDYALVKRLESPLLKVEDVGISYDTHWMILNQNTGTNPKTGKPYVVPWKQRLYRNQKFRQAVSYAIDRQGIVNTVFGGRAVPIYSCVSPGDAVWYSDDIMKYPYDPQRARQMFAEIGLKDNNGDGLLEDGEGHTVEIKMVTNVSNSQRVETTTFVAKNLRDVGIKALPTPVPFTVMTGLMQETFDFDALVLGWQVNPPPGPGGSTNILLSSALNHANFPLQKTPSTEWEARIDELVYKMIASTDETERRRLYAELQRIWSEQLPEITLVSQYEAVAYRNKFANVHPGALQPRLTWNIDEIYIRK